MFGKCFLLVLVCTSCISFVQVRGDEDLQAAIREALRIMSIERENTNKVVKNLFPHDVSAPYTKVAKRMAMTINFMQKKKDNLQQTLDELLAVLREDAHDLEKPPSALECLTRVHQNASRTGESLCRKIKSEMYVMYYAASQEHEDAIRLFDKNERMYNFLVSSIWECKDAKCVVDVQNRYKAFTSTLPAILKRAEQEMISNLEELEEEFSDHFADSNKEVQAFKMAAGRKMSKCLDD